MLPVTSFVEEEGTLTNSSRVVSGSGRRPIRTASRAPTSRSWPTSSCASAQLYEEEGGTAAEPLLAVDWSYADPAQPTADELLKELNGKALADLTDAEGKVTRKAGEQLASFGEMRDDGSTDGVAVDLHRRLRAERQLRPAARQRGPERPRGLRRLGLRLAGQPAHPLQPRLGRPAGQAVERGEGLHLLGRREAGPGRTCRTSSPTNAPSNGVGPVHHEPGGRLAPLGRGA